MQNTCVTRNLRTLSLAIAAILALAPTAHAQWTAPTPEELSMTSQPGAPNAPAVYLYREEVTNDDLHDVNIYVRLKVLNEKGKEYANVDLDYFNGTQSGFETSIDNIAGRTIHPDGAIIPFTGKPYQKLVQRTHDVRAMSKVFTLPDVQVGSIIEYHYRINYPDGWVFAPQWIVQTDLYTRKVHFAWAPTDKDILSDEGGGSQITSSLFWTPLLPNGVAVKHEQVHTGRPGHDLQNRFSLDMADVAAYPEEDYMPPIRSLSFRVLFYYSPYRNQEEFWKNEPKYWSKKKDKFIGPGPKVTAAVRDLISPSDTSDQKLRKLYAAVMKLDNTRYSREHSAGEDKAAGFRDIHNADDIWERKRGTDDQLTELFVAMARAAGFKAYLGAVTSRDNSLFLKMFPSLNQLNDFIAIVNVDGKEVFFDPGSRYCAYGHLSWPHSMAGGVRQVEGGGAIFETPGEPYTSSITQRIADLKIDEHGSVSGPIKMTYIGDPPLTWRQQALQGDQHDLEDQVRSSVMSLMPPGINVTFASMDHLEDYEQPLTVTFTTSGALGTGTGKRILLPSDIFESFTPAVFPHEKRTVSVAFHFSHITQDVMRISFPPTLTIESAPANDKTQFQQFALCTTALESKPTSFLTRRNFTMGEIFYKPDEYPELRSFYSKIEDRDKQSVVLTLTSNTKPAAGN